MKNVREKAIETALSARVAALGGIAYKFISPGRNSVPDRLVLMPGGKAYFVELKAPGRKPSDAQRREHLLLQAMGFDVHVIDTLDGVALFLKALS